MKTLVEILVIIFCVAALTVSTMTVDAQEDTEPDYVIETNVSLPPEPAINPLTEIVGSIIFSEMIPQGDNPHITEEDAYLAANQIIYLMDEYGMVDEDLPYVLSLFYVESRFDSLAVNRSSNASGFGQILPRMHREKLEFCGGWELITCNIYVAFQIIAYQEYAHQNIESRWYNVYRFNYHTGPGMGWYGASQVDKFQEALENAYEGGK